MKKSNSRHYHDKPRPAGSKLARKAAEGKIGMRNPTKSGLALKSHFDRARDMTGQGRWY